MFSPATKEQASQFKELREEMGRQAREIHFGSYFVTEERLLKGDGGYYIRGAAIGGLAIVGAKLLHIILEGTQSLLG